MTDSGKALVRFQSPSSTKLLTRVLEHPALVAAVRELPPFALGRLIDSIGLEGAGELVALATTEQLQGVFDRDLWTAARAGEDELFDPARFALWLEVMLEAGDAAVVERLTELPLDLITLAVHRLVLVVDIDALAVAMSDGGDESALTEKALEGWLYEEWEEFRLMAKDSAAWDSILTALFALDRDHHDRLRRILECCANMSLAALEDHGGLYELLTADEMLEGDTRATRDDRRSAEGYVTPADAKSFLGLARAGHAYPLGRDPVTRAYFREVQPGTREASSQNSQPSRESGNASADLAGLMRLIGSATGEPIVTGPRLLVAAASQPSVAQEAARTLDSALELLAAEYPDVYALRIEELSYLANVLISGYAQGGRRLRPVEATEGALTICSLGLDWVLAELRISAREPRRDVAAAALCAVPADRLFRIAWRHVHDQPSEWSGA